MKNIHVLPTENYKQDYTLQSGEVVEVVRLGQLIKNSQTNELLINKSSQWAASCDTDVLVPHHIYITSDEEIKDNDYITDGYLVWKWKDDSSLLGRKKIILTTDQDLIKDGIQEMPDEFLEWFVKNPSCEKVEVVKGFADGTNYGYNFLDYKIIIPKEEHKQEDCSCTDKCLGYLTKTCERIEQPDYTALLQPVGTRKETLEEAAENYSEGWGENNDEKSFIAGAKWQQEQILDFLYSEITERRDYSASKMCEKVIEFIEQFKNK